MNSAATSLTIAEQKTLLGLARESLMEFVRTGKQPQVDESSPLMDRVVARASRPCEQEHTGETPVPLRSRSALRFRDSKRELLLVGRILTPKLREPRGCFVTLTRHGELRGCIGNTQPRDPLFLAVINNASGAAFRDTRFSSVRGTEIPELEIEISVLTEPRPLAFVSPEDLLGKLRPYLDGVVLKMEGKTSTFLPQVWEKIPGGADFMDELARKARFSASAWRGPGVEISTYQVESFTDAPSGG